jgi:hypothetical protein
VCTSRERVDARGIPPGRTVFNACADGASTALCAVKCPGGCDEELFCSDACAEACWQRHHRLLCVGAAGRQADAEGVAGALSRFKNHADFSNDVFHVVAQVDNQRHSFKSPHHRLRQVHTSPTQHRMQVVAATALRAEAAGGGEAALLRAWEPFSVGWKAVWWETVARPADVEAKDEAEFRQQLRDLATESAALLAQALPETAVREP